MTTTIQTAYGPIEATPPTSPATIGRTLAAAVRMTGRSTPMPKRQPEPHPCRKCGQETTNAGFVCDACHTVCSGCTSFHRRSRIVAGRFRPHHYCWLTGLGVDDNQPACALFHPTPPACPPGLGSTQRPPGGMGHIQYRMRRAWSGY